jgi:hypothetical protein
VKKYLDRDPLPPLFILLELYGSLELNISD